MTHLAIPTKSLSDRSCFCEHSSWAPRGLNGCQGLHRGCRLHRTCSLAVQVAAHHKAAVCAHSVLHRLVCGDASSTLWVRIES